MSKTKNIRRKMFGYGNSKLVHLAKRLGLRVATFDLLAGHTCPMANICRAQVVVRNGKKRIQQLGQFLCYATKAEAIYPSVYALHKINRTRAERKTFVARAIREIRENKIDIVRIHSSGDFYSWEYFQKWVEIAKAMPHVKFFGYTKQATFVKWLVANPIANMRIVYSHGGLLDKYAAQNELPTCYVETYDCQYPNVPLACDAVHSDDFEYVWAQVSFKIAFH